MVPGVYLVWHYMNMVKPETGDRVTIRWKFITRRGEMETEMNTWMDR